MSNKQQTAVEWLEDKFAQFVMYEEGHFKAKPYTLTELYADFHQAKELEKQQIIDARLNGHISTYIGCESGCGANYYIDDSGEQYYNETYGE